MESANNPKTIASSLGTAFWSVFLIFIKQKTVEFAIKNILGVALKTAGFKVWVVKFLAENFADEIVLPTMNGLLVEGKFIAHSHQGKSWVAKLKEADNVQEHNDVVDDILS